MKDNIILIGMPGVGKSTIGVILAKQLGYEFVDSDLLIQKKEGRLLSEIIAMEGTEGFLKVEEAVNASIDVHRSIVATGGSAVYSEKAMQHLKEIGQVVYLSVPCEVLSPRLTNMKGRGVVLKEGQTLEDLFVERIPLYEKYADVIVEEVDADMEATLAMLLKELS